MKKLDPDREVKVVSAAGLAECKKMLALAKAGKYNGYLLEGMACPGGCIGGAGNICSTQFAARLLETRKKNADFAHSADTVYADWLPDLETLDFSLRDAPED